MNAEANARYCELLEHFGYEDDEWRDENENGMHCTSFLYGTLRKGMSNYWLMEALIDLGHAKFVGKGYVPSHIILDIGGLPAMYRVSNRQGYSSVGEIYSLSWIALDVLDAFEGNGQWYYKSSVPVTKTHFRDGNKIKRQEECMAFIFVGPSIDFTAQDCKFKWHGFTNEALGRSKSDYCAVPVPRPFEANEVPHKSVNGRLSMQNPGAIDFAGINAKHALPVDPDDRHHKKLAAAIDRLFEEQEELEDVG